MKTSIARVTAASSIGSIIEWYDFLLAATLAVILWPALFFSNQISASLAISLSIVSVGIPYLTRPIGAYLFGHYGDRLGRKNTMAWTLSTMGVGTLGIAILPTYASIGVLAPILLNVFRAVQGLGLGGEWGGAMSWVSEFASRSRQRGFWTGIIASTTGLGVAMSSGFIIIAELLLPQAAFASWGWRILFLIGFLVLIAGITIRYKFADSPLFNTIKREERIAKSPAWESVRRYWKNMMQLGVVSCYVAFIAVGLMIVFIQDYLIGSGISPLFVSFTLVASFAAYSVLSVISGALSDATSRRKVSIIGSVATAAWLYPYFLLLSSLNYNYIMLGQVVLGMLIGFGFGVIPSLLTENFQTKYRYSGSGISYQVGSVLVGVLIVFMIPYIISFGGPNAFFYMTLLGIIVCLASALAAFNVKDLSSKALNV